MSASSIQDPISYVNSNGSKLPLTVSCVSILSSRAPARDFVNTASLALRLLDYARYDARLKFALSGHFINSSELKTRKLERYASKLTGHGLSN